MAQATWKGIEAKELIDGIVAKYGLPSLASLARMLGSHPMTVSGWRCGRIKPGKASMAKLRKLAELPQWGSDAFTAMSFVAYNTTAFDAAQPMYESVAVTGDPGCASLACMSVLYKVANLLDNCVMQKSSGTVKPLMEVSALYGDPDSTSLLTCGFMSVTGDRLPKSATVTVLCRTIDSLPRYLYKVDILEGSNITASRAGVVTDEAIDKIARTILTNIPKRYARRQYAS